MEGQKTGKKHGQVTFQDIGPCSIWWAMKLSFTRKRRLGALYKNKKLNKNVQFCPTFRFQAFLRIFCFMLETKSPFQYHHHFQICLCFRFNRKMREMFLLLVLFLCFFPINSNKVAASRLCRWLVYSLIIHKSQFVFQLYLYLNWTKMKSFNINILLRLPWHFKAGDNTWRTQVSCKNAREGKRPHVIKIFGRQALSFFIFPSVALFMWAACPL